MIRQVLYKQLDNNAKTLLYDGGGAFFFKTPNYRGVQFFSHRCKAPGGGSDSTNKIKHET
jgi:hypothetical protein